MKKEDTINVYPNYTTKETQALHQLVITLIS